MAQARCLMEGGKQSKTKWNWKAIPLCDTMWQTACHIAVSFGIVDCDIGIDIFGLVGIGKLS